MFTLLLNKQSDVFKEDYKFCGLQIFVCKMNSPFFWKHMERGIIRLAAHFHPRESHV